MIKFLTKILSAQTQPQYPSPKQEFEQIVEIKYFGLNELKKDELQCILCNENINVSSNGKHNCNMR